MAGIAAALKARVLRFRREIVVVGYAVRHAETPLRLKVGGLGLILYLISPIDLIPILVPVVGLLDDLILVPWGLGQVVGRLPSQVRAEAEADAARFIDRYLKRPLIFVAVLAATLIVLWVGLLWLLWWIFIG